MNNKNMWRPFKYYPKHFASKKEEFMYRLHNGIHTTKSLLVLLDAFPQHKYKNEILTELERRKNAS
tara:strand:+ start:316 stop:513 length:198 start_codon:yes stop_codon:yes gene_type:complete